MLSRPGPLMYATFTAERLCCVARIVSNRLEMTAQQFEVPRGPEQRVHEKPRVIKTQLMKRIFDGACIMGHCGQQWP